MSTRSLTSRWLPPLALMGLIFFLSAQPDLRSNLGLVDLVGRKAIHAAEYALLCVLWWRALWTVASRGAAISLAFAISVGYAATDELHQTFVPGRHGSPVDVGIDAFGAAVAAFLLRRRLERAPAAGEPARATAGRAG
jgi:VanZ family protein